MYRTTIISVAASAALLLGACGSSASSEASDGIASLDTVASTSVSDDDNEGDSSSDSAVIDEAGNDADNGDGGDAELSEDDIEQAYAEYEKCLEDIGLGDLFSADGAGDGVVTDVQIDSSGAGGGLEGDPADFDAKFERMEEECEPLIAAVSANFELSPEEEAEMADAELEFARCMRDAGFDFPDPSSGGGAIQAIEVDQENFDIDALNEASEKCTSVFDELFGAASEEL